MTEGVGQINRQGQIVRLNKQASHFAKGQIKPGMTLLQACRILKTRTEDGQLVNRVCQLPTYRALQNGETVRNLIYLMTTPVSKKQRYIACASAPIFDAQGKVSSAVLHLTDITSQKEAEKQIEEFTLLLSEKIAEQNRETEEFIYGITHDLKAPIVTIQGFLRQIYQKQRGLLPDEAQRQLNILMQASDRLWKMVDGLLKFARISDESDTSHLVPQHRIVEQVLADQSHEVTEARAQIRIDPLPSAYISETQAYQIWANLINNALRYRHRTRRLRLHLGYDNRREAYFVKDNGIGIDAKFQKQIFNIFGRFSSDPMSTGIGLSHVRKVVETANGKIWVKSSANRGACFYFQLPTA